jgi:hypothetical protein
VALAFVNEDFKNASVILYFIDKLVPIIYKGLIYYGFNLGNIIFGTYTGFYIIYGTLLIIQK